MQIITTLVALATLTLAHYNYPSMILNGATTSQWDYVRQWTGYQSYNPVVDVTLVDIRCNVDGSTHFAPDVLSVPAGSVLSFDVFPDTTGIYHPGPLLAYMAKVPSGKTAANWDGSGSVWFKIYEEEPVFTSGAMNWPLLGADTLSFTIPKDVPNGDYLFRVEQIGLHVASTVNGAQFYISCGQITITGGGSGTPGPLVAFPGAYSPTEPGLLIDIYYPIPTSYAMPGPAVWSGGGGGSTGPTTPSSPGGKTTTTPAAPPAATTPTGTGSTGGPTVPQYGQCGGQGWTGGTTCASGFTCKVSNAYYSQCL